MIAERKRQRRFVAFTSSPDGEAMARFACRCGTIIRDDDPDFSLMLNRRRVFDASRDIDDLFFGAHDGLECPTCGRLWIFWERGPDVPGTEYVRWRPSMEESAERLQAARGVTLSRSPDPAVDWVDERGRTYAAVGNYRGRHFAQEWPHLQTRIRDAVDAANVVVVDTSEFSQEQKAQVQAFIAPLGTAVVVVDVGWQRR